MILPSLQGNFHQTGFFIYAAADSRYFDLYGKSLINSVLANTDHGVHIHIYNPTQVQIEFCQRPKVSATWEHTLPHQFNAAYDFWSRNDLPEPAASRKIKMLGLKQYENNQDLMAWIKKTYYACMRFVRLAEFLPVPMRFLEIDVDGIVRKSFDTVLPHDNATDIYLYEKTKKDKTTGEIKRTGHLAGSILFTDKPQALQFAKDLADLIRQNIASDNIYWFLDQHSLDQVIVDYRKGLLPMSYIDWHMDRDSSIWTAKGRRKELEIFQHELRRYL